MPEPSNADILAKLIQHDAALAAADSERAHLSARLDVLGQTVESHSDMLRDLREALIGHGGEFSGIHGTVGKIEADLASLTERVNRNSATLDAHTVTLDAHSAMLSDHGRRLTSHGDLLATILATVTRIEGRLGEK